MSGRHAGPPAGSGAREATAPPWHGHHRAPDEAGTWTFRINLETGEQSAEFTPDPPRCPQCTLGHLLLNGGPHCPNCGWESPDDPPRCASCGHHDGCPCTCCPGDSLWCATPDDCPLGPDDHEFVPPEAPGLCCCRQPWEVGDGV